jgi:uncharacterized cupredoxin-like copper-binding protein
MKKVLLTMVIATAATMSAHAKSYTYRCAQARTTAEEAKATTPIKVTTMTTDGVKLYLSSANISIKEADPRLLNGGVPAMHHTKGGYFTSTAGEVFLCQREI